MLLKSTLLILCLLSENTFDHTTTASPTSVALAAVCAPSRDADGSRYKAPFFVRPKTAPIFRMGSLLGATIQAPTAEQLQAALQDEDSLRKTHIGLDVRLPAGKTPCKYEYVDDAATPQFILEHTIVEISSPIRNPYVSKGPTEMGVFIRVSRGGAWDSTWFWIGLDESLSEVKRIVQLAIQE